jgi:hypothetical protein
VLVLLAALPSSYLSPSDPIADGDCIADALKELSDLVSLALSSALATHPVI